jgi:uncharacterized iron-regulated membrane protein
MDINTRTAAVQNFNDIKAEVRLRAASGDQELIKVQGDRYEVTESYSVESPSGNYTVRGGSFFDNDPKTRDKVAVDMHQKAEGTTESRRFEQYSAKKLIFFSEDRLAVEVTKGQQGNGAWFSSTGKFDFSI